MQNINDIGYLYEMIQSTKKKNLQKIIKKIFRIKKKSGLDSFEGEIILTQYCIENKKIDAYFSKYKLGIEIDEYNHESRNSNFEKSRQLMIESYGITIIITNPMLQILT